MVLRQMLDKFDHLACYQGRAHGWLHTRNWRAHRREAVKFGFMSHIAFPADGSKLYNLKTGHFLPGCRSSSSYPTVGNSKL